MGTNEGEKNPDIKISADGSGEGQVTPSTNSSPLPPPRLLLPDPVAPIPAEQTSFVLEGQQSGAPDGSGSTQNWCSLPQKPAAVGLEPKPVDGSAQPGLTPAPQGNSVPEAPESPVPAVQQNPKTKKYFFADKTGNNAFDGKEFDWAESFSEGFAVVEIGDKWHYIDKTGANAFNGKEFDGVRDFSEGFAAVKIGDKWHYIDKTGANAFNGKEFDYAESFSEGFAVVEIGDKRGYVDKDGTFQDTIPGTDSASAFTPVTAQEGSGAGVGSEGALSPEWPELKRVPSKPCHPKRGKLAKIMLATALLAFAAGAADMINPDLKTDAWKRVSGLVKGFAEKVPAGKEGGERVTGTVTPPVSDETQCVVSVTGNKVHATCDGFDTEDLRLVFPEGQQPSTDDLVKMVVIGQRGGKTATCDIPSFPRQPKDSKDAVEVVRGNVKCSAVK